MVLSTGLLYLFVTKRFDARAVRDVRLKAGQIYIKVTGCARRHVHTTHALIPQVHKIYS